MDEGAGDDRLQRREAAPVEELRAENAALRAELERIRARDEAPTEPPPPNKAATAKEPQRDDTSSDDDAHDEPHIWIDETTDESRASATGSAVAHVLGRPDAIRQRAQNAATTSSAVFAALLVGAVVQLTRDEYESWHWLTLAFVFVAFITWIVSVWLFIRVVDYVPTDPLKDLSYQKWSTPTRRTLIVFASV